MRNFPESGSDDSWTSFGCSIAIVAWDYFEIMMFDTEEPEMNFYITT